MRRLARILSGGEGAEIAEAAMVLPLVFMFLMGIVWFGRAFNIYATITQAAQQGALTAARAGCATCGAAFPDKAIVADKVIAVLQASSLDRTQIKTYQPPLVQGCKAATATCQASQKVTVCSQVLLNPISGPPPPTPQPPQCGTMVSFQYPFQFFLPFTSLNGQQILLTAQAQSRMEN
jgi:Flp pilus assembly protein TadG